MEYWVACQKWGYTEEKGFAMVRQAVRFLGKCCRASNLLSVSYF